MEESRLTTAAQAVKAARAAIDTSDYSQASASLSEATSNCYTALLSLYCTHASVLITAEKFDQALIVAEQAISVSSSHSLAWYWKGMSLYRIGNEQLARAAFKKAAHYEKDLSKKTSYMDWAAKCDADIVTIDATASDQAQPKVTPAPSQSARTMPMHDAAAAPKPQPPKSNVRMEWYESKTHVNIEIYAKNVVKEESVIEINDDSVKFILKRPEKEDYTFETQLFASVIPAESTWNINRFKFEARLKKLRQSDKWRSLDHDGTIVSKIVQVGVDARRMNVKKQAHDREMKKFTDTELKDYKEDDSAAALFRTLYKDGDEDMRRAMMKSYTESNGKVLSTNWDEVKKKKVEYEESKSS